MHDESGNLKWIRQFATLGEDVATGVAGDGSGAYVVGYTAGALSSQADEQQRRLFAGLESIRLGHGGDTLLGDFLGLDAHTIARGRQQLLDRNIVSGRIRRQGGGRHPAEKKRRT